jgi:hypothetical protein
MNTATIKAIVIDKRIKEGWFGRKYYMTLRFAEEIGGEPAPTSGRVVERRASLEQYHNAEINLMVEVTLYQHRDGHFYIDPE